MKWVALPHGCPTMASFYRLIQSIRWSEIELVDDLESANETRIDLLHTHANVFLSRKLAFEVSSKHTN